MARKVKLNAEAFERDNMEDCKVASSHSNKSQEFWGKAIHKGWNSVPADQRRWITIDMRKHCVTHRIDVPYSVPYLVQLGETNEAVKGNWDRGVPISVLIEGRYLPDLLEIVEKEKDTITVQRMRALVLERAGDGTKTADEIEDELEAQRKERGSRTRHDKQTEAILNIEDFGVLMSRYGSNLSAYRKQFRRMLKSKLPAHVESEDLEDIIETHEALGTMLENALERISQQEAERVNEDDDESYEDDAEEDAA